MLTYSDSAADVHFPHYMLIEGMIGKNETRVVFIIEYGDAEPYVIIKGCFPKRAQKLSIVQFYEWLASPIKQQTNFMQNQNFDLSEGLKIDIKKQFKNLRDDIKRE